MRLKQKVYILIKGGGGLTTEGLRTGETRIDRQRRFRSEANGLEAQDREVAVSIQATVKRRRYEAKHELPTLLTTESNTSNDRMAYYCIKYE